MHRVDLGPFLRSEVIDIRDSMCPLVDKILVDTNVLYFCYYDRFSELDILGEGPKSYQISDYPPFLKRLLSSGAVLFVHEVGLLEFTNLVKNAELKLLYSNKNKTWSIPPDFSPKEIRQTYPNEYFSIQRAIQTYLHAIKKTFELLIQDISLELLLVDFLLEWQDSLADVGEAMMIAEARRKGINSILSDDADILTLKDVRFYTANEMAINAFSK